MILALHKTEAKEHCARDNAQQGNLHSFPRKFVRFIEHNVWRKGFVSVTYRCDFTWNMVLLLGIRDNFLDLFKHLFLNETDFICEKKNTGFKIFFKTWINCFAFKTRSVTCGYCPFSFQCILHWLFDVQSSYILTSNTCLLSLFSNAMIFLYNLLRLDLSRVHILFSQ